MKKLIVNADDFGLAIPVNEAVEEAHRHGLLRSASLMASGRACSDAVERARAMPSLRVGLHVTLVEGRPVLPVSQVPDLVDGSGEFSRRLFRAGVRFFFRRRVRRQLEAEIRAQFEAFQATGLALDHVNAHNHMHLHPTVGRLIVSMTKEYGCHAVRIPIEPLGPSFRAFGFSPSRVAARLFLWPWATLLRNRARAEGLTCNDWVLGLYDSGSMGPARVRALLLEAPEGVTEMYFHPATRRCPELDRDMLEYMHQAELQALTEKGVRDAVLSSGATLTTFSDIAAERILARGEQEEGFNEWSAS